MQAHTSLGALLSVMAVQLLANHDRQKLLLLTSISCFLLSCRDPFQPMYSHVLSSNSAILSGARPIGTHSVIAGPYSSLFQPSAAYNHCLTWACMCGRHAAHALLRADSIAHGSPSAVQTGLTPASALCLHSKPAVAFTSQPFGMLAALDDASLRGVVLDSDLVEAGVSSYGEQAMLAWD